MINPAITILDEMIEEDEEGFKNIYETQEILQEAKKRIEALGYWWVKYSDRKPTDDEEYIVYNIQDEVVTTALFSTDRNRFLGDFITVSHWMNLPTPPKK